MSVENEEFIPELRFTIRIKNEEIFKIINSLSSKLEMPKNKIITNILETYIYDWGISQSDLEPKYKDLLVQLKNKNSLLVPDQEGVGETIDKNFIFLENQQLQMYLTTIIKLQQEIIQQNNKNLTKSDADKFLFDVREIMKELSQGLKSISYQKQSSKNNE